MRELLRHIEAEQPRVNALLGRQTDTLDLYVRPVVAHVLKAGGKRLRPLLVLLTARALGRDSDDLYPMACALEFLHSATLLHDDVLDQAQTRRGIAAAHILFGVTKTILAGDALLALGNKLMADYGEPRLTACISEAILRTAVGEVAEIANVGNLDLTQAQYLEIVTGKTAWLIQAACRCGAIAAKAEDRLEQAASDFGLNLGVAFQLVDDALDYAGDSRATGKPIAADLVEGKVTLPLLCWLDTLDDAARHAFRRDFACEERDPERLLHVVKLVQASGCHHKALKVAAGYLDTARSALALFPQSEERTLLEQALEYVLNREK